MHLSSPVQAPALGFHGDRAPEPRCQWSNVVGEPRREAEKKRVHKGENEGNDGVIDRVRDESKRLDDRCYQKRGPTATSGTAASRFSTESVE